VGFPDAAAPAATQSEGKNPPPRDGTTTVRVKVADMPTQRNTDPPRSPVPGVIPEPVRVEQDATEVSAPARSNPGAEREARHQAREEARGPRTEWLIGLVVSVVSLVLAAVLWSSRRI